MQDLDKLSERELKILKRMAGVFAEQAGHVEVGGSQFCRRIHSEFRRGSRLVPSRSMSRVGLFEGTCLKGLRSLSLPDGRFRRQGAVLGPCFSGKVMVSYGISVHLGDVILLLFCQCYIGLVIA